MRADERRLKFLSALISAHPWLKSEQNRLAQLSSDRLDLTGVHADVHGGREDQMADRRAPAAKLFGGGVIQILGSARFCELRGGGEPLVECFDQLCLLLGT